MRIVNIQIQHILYLSCMIVLPACSNSSKVNNRSGVNGSESRSAYEVKGKLEFGAPSAGLKLSDAEFDALPAQIKGLNGGVEAKNDDPQNPACPSFDAKPLLITLNNASGIEYVADAGSSKCLALQPEIKLTSVFVQRSGRNGIVEIKLGEEIDFGNGVVWKFEATGDANKSFVLRRASTSATSEISVRRSTKKSAPGRVAIDAGGLCTRAELNRVEGSENQIEVNVYGDFSQSLAPAFPVANSRTVGQFSNPPVMSFGVSPKAQFVLSFDESLSAGEHQFILNIDAAPDKTCRLTVSVALSDDNATPPPENGSEPVVVMPLCDSQLSYAALSMAKAPGVNLPLDLPADVLGTSANKSDSSSWCLDTRFAKINNVDTLVFAAPFEKYHCVYEFELDASRIASPQSYGAVCASSIASAVKNDCRCSSAPDSNQQCQKSNISDSAQDVVLSKLGFLSNTEKTNALKSTCVSGFVDSVRDANDHWTLVNSKVRKCDANDGLVGNNNAIVQSTFLGSEYLASDVELTACDAAANIDDILAAINLADATLKVRKQDFCQISGQTSGASDMVSQKWICVLPRYYNTANAADRSHKSNCALPLMTANVTANEVSKKSFAANSQFVGLEQRADCRPPDDTQTQPPAGNNGDANGAGTIQTPTCMIGYHLENNQCVANSATPNSGGTLPGGTSGGVQGPTVPVCSDLNTTYNSTLGRCVPKCPDGQMYATAMEQCMAGPVAPSQPNQPNPVAPSQPSNPCDGNTQMYIQSGSATPCTPVAPSQPNQPNPVAPSQPSQPSNPCDGNTQMYIQSGSATPCTPIAPQPGLGIVISCESKLGRLNANAEMLSCPNGVASSLTEPTLPQGAVAFQKFKCTSSNSEPVVAEYVYCSPNPVFIPGASTDWNTGTSTSTDTPTPVPPAYEPGQPSAVVGGGGNGGNTLNGCPELGPAPTSCAGRTSQGFLRPTKLTGDNNCEVWSCALVPDAALCVGQDINDCSGGTFVTCPANLILNGNVCICPAGQTIKSNGACG